MRRLCLLLGFAFLLPAAPPARAQGSPAGPPFAAPAVAFGEASLAETSTVANAPLAPAPPVDRLEDAGRRPWVRIGKWVSLATSLGAAGWGLKAHRDADDRYRSLEADCEADPTTCSARNPDGSFADPALEGRYQSILDLDRRARWALVASQVGVLTSVTLFVLDMRRDREPSVIPYEPTASVRLAPAAGGGVALSLDLVRGDRPTR